MKTHVRAITRGAVVSIAAATLVLTVAVLPAAAAAPTVGSFDPTSGLPGTLVSITGTGFTGGIGVIAVTFNFVGTTYNVTDDQHLTTTVPIGATTGRIRVTTSDGTGTSLADFVVPSSPPSITSFSPSSGPPGTSVTIMGAHFTGVNGVKFNGVAATFNFVSDAQVSATVPLGATTGKITLTTPLGPATSASNFIVGSSTPPTISGFSPTSGAPGATVTINGDNFTGVNGVRFNGVAATFSFVNDGRVTATVPSGATTGKITLTTPAGTATSSSNFTVTSSGPTISSISPTSGGVGTSVTINGDRFTGVTGVRFNGTSAAYSFVNDDRVIATVPNGATTGRITVTTPSGTATSSSNFTVTGGGTHERNVSLKISGRYASGRVSVNDGYSACSSNVPVVIKRFHHGDWHWVTTTSTSSDGSYRALIGGRDGRYRARAKRVTLVNGAICDGDQSPVVHH